MSLARSLFYAWEKRLAFKDDPERRVLDFQWGAEFLPPFGSWHPPEITPSESEARALLHDHAERAVPSIYSSARPEREPFYFVPSIYSSAYIELD